MKRNIIVSIFCIAFISFFSINKAVSQNQELKFSKVLIVGNIEQSVPANTVWKVTSIFGEEADICVQVKSGNYYAKANVSCFYINGIKIPSTIRGLLEGSTMYVNNTCSSVYSGTHNLIGANQASDPNVLPIWLPTGSTLKSCGSNTFLSIIEFTTQ